LTQLGSAVSASPHPSDIILRGSAWGVFNRLVVIAIAVAVAGFNTKTTEEQTTTNKHVIARNIRV
jgi:hypothetical protein